MSYAAESSPQVTTQPATGSASKLENEAKQVATGAEPGGAQQLAAVTGFGEGPSGQPGPTIDIARLYAHLNLAENVEQKNAVDDFIRIQALFSDRAACLEYLNDLAQKVKAASSEGTTTEEALDQVLSQYETEAGFRGDIAVLVKFASRRDFQQMASTGQLFHDLGAGAAHGQWAHRIQWFMVLSDRRKHPGKYHYPPVALYQKFVDDIYVVTGVFLLEGGSGGAQGRNLTPWDIVFDRTDEIRIKRSGHSVEGSKYNPSRDGKPHPGDVRKAERGADATLMATLRSYSSTGDGESGAASSEKLPLPGLADFLDREYACFGDLQIAAGKNLKVADLLGLARGRSPGTGEPTYFQQSDLRGIPVDELIEFADIFSRCAAWLHAGPDRFWEYRVRVEKCLAEAKTAQAEASRLSGAALEYQSQVILRFEGLIVEIEKRLANMRKDGGAVKVVGGVKPE